MTTFEGWIYLIHNTITKKFYVGQTIDIKKRINEHFTGKGSKPLYKSILKQGARGYEVYILNTAYSKSELNRQEAFYIQKYQAADYGYNIERGNCTNRVNYKPAPFESYKYDADIDYEYYERLELIGRLRSIWMSERHIENNKIINGIFDNSDETIAKFFPRFESWQDIRDFARGVRSEADT